MSPEQVKAGDSNLEIALSLNIGKVINPTNSWIQNFTDNATGNSLNIGAKSIEHMKFSSTDQGLSNITQHAKDGKLTSEVDVKGNLVLTFNAQQQQQGVVPDANLRAALNTQYFKKPTDTPITKEELASLQSNDNEVKLKIKIYLA